MDGMDYIILILIAWWGWLVLKAERLHRKANRPVRMGNQLSTLRNQHLIKRQILTKLSQSRLTSAATSEKEAR